MSYLSFVKSFFGDDPSQYVEPSDWEGFKNDVAVATKRGIISKSEAQELMGTFKLSIGELAEKFVKKVESAIRLTPSDKANSKTHEVKATEFEAPKRTQKIREDRTIDD